MIYAKLSDDPYLWARFFAHRKSNLCPNKTVNLLRICCPYGSSYIRAYIIIVEWDISRYCITILSTTTAENSQKKKEKEDIFGFLFVFFS
jgi:hypothetical protein